MNLKKTTQFKQLLQSNQLEFIMEAHNGGSAKIVQETGFKGIWASGLCMSAAMGVRDNNEASWTQVLEVLEFMSDNTEIPILVDADTGYGNFNNARRLVRKLEQRKIAAMCIEDKCFPKTNSFISGEQQPLAEIEEFALKIKAAKDSQSDPDFCVVARVEALIAGWGLEEALRRAEAYYAAGADAILMHSKINTPDQIVAFMKEWKNACPVVIVPTMYYETPTEVFEEAGVSLVIWANHLYRSSVKAMQATAGEIFNQRSLKTVEKEIVSVKEIFRLQNAAELKEAEKRYLPTNGSLGVKRPASRKSRSRSMTDATAAAEETAASDGRKPPHAIVIGLDCMTGLQTARILAGHGIPVIAIAKNRDHYCCRTNVCERILFANTGNEEFVDALERFCSDLPQKPVLYPCTDMAVLTLSRSRDRLADGFHVVLPPADVVEQLMDKISFFALAKEKSLAIPGTFLLRNRIEAKEAAEQLNFPCILKPPMKTPTWEKNTKLKVFKIASAADFLSVYDRCCDWAEILMAQEWIEGTDANLYSYNGYFNADSEPLVSFIARKIRQWPPEIGTSCLGEEVRNDEVLEESIRLFQSVGYRGLGYVEMKRDERTGKHYIIEPNIGRPTGRSAISEAGGVELLYTMYCDVLGWPLPENREQKYEGVKWISIRRDAQSAFFYWRRGDLTLRDWWKSWRGRKGYAVWSKADPAPFWSDLWRSIGIFARRRSPNPNFVDRPRGVQPPAAGPEPSDGAGRAGPKSAEKTEV